MLWTCNVIRDKIFLFTFEKTPFFYLTRNFYVVKTIEDLSEEEVTHLNLPNSIPFVYDLDPESLKPLKPKRYLADEETVQKAVNKVASIGPKKNEQNWKYFSKTHSQKIT